MNNKEGNTEASVVDGDLSRITNVFKKKMSNNISNENNIRDIINEALKEQMEKIKRDVLHHIDSRMNDTVSEVLKVIKQATPTKVKESTKLDKHCDKKKSSSGFVRDKEFIERNSLLTDLYEVKHIRTIYKLSILTLIIILVNNAVNDVMETGSPRFYMDTILSGFGKFPVVVYIWSLMTTLTFGSYFGYRFWAHRRLEYSPKSRARKAWDYGCLIALVFYEIIFLIVPTKMLLDEDLPIPSSLIVLMEQIRMLMKMYAFIRSAAPRYLSYKPHSDTPIPKPPNFEKFLYFFFAPTLIYRDSYPRTKEIRWRMVFRHIAEFVGIIFCVAFVYENFMFSPFRQYGTERMEWRTIVIMILKTLIPAGFFFVFGFYCLLHCWLNVFAEVMRFADKLFYEDWWNATTYSDYYRTWNVVVYDFLHLYVYKDMYEIVTRRNKWLSAVTVILISAIAHEYILSLSLRFCYPLLFLLLCGPGIILPAYSIGNAVVWLFCCLGVSMSMCLYAIEYFARMNCPSYRDDFVDVFLPRTWICSNFFSA